MIRRWRRAWRSAARVRAFRADVASVSTRSPTGGRCRSPSTSSWPPARAERHYCARSSSASTSRSRSSAAPRACHSSTRRRRRRQLRGRRRRRRAAASAGGSIGVGSDSARVDVDDEGRVAARAHRRRPWSGRGDAVDAGLVGAVEGERLAAGDLVARRRRAARPEVASPRRALAVAQRDLVVLADEASAPPARAAARAPR